MAYELEHYGEAGEDKSADRFDGRWRDLKLLEISGEQFQAFNYEARSFFSSPEWRGWSQERLEQYFFEFELPAEHAAKYTTFRSLVEARDIDGVLAFIADNGGTQVEAFWFVAYWQIILATVGTNKDAATLRKRIPWTVEEVTITLTARELEMAISAALDACNTCSNQQIRNLGKIGKEKEFQYYERRRAEYWSLQAKLRTCVSQPSSEASAT